MTNQQIALPEHAIAEFCRRHHIRRLSMFGSALRGNLRPDSDLDILVEFEPGHVPGFGFVDLGAELSALFGRRVDLNTPNSLSRYFRERVLSEARVLYAR
jgi:predicted nucleotidyltransferase